MRHSLRFIINQSNVCLVSGDLQNQQRLKIIPEAQLTSTILQTSTSSNDVNQRQPSEDSYDAYSNYLELPNFGLRTIASNAIGFLINPTNPTITSFPSSSPIRAEPVIVSNLFPPSNSSADLRKHVSASNPPNREIIPFKCPLCSLIYRTQTYLNEHMRKEHSVLIWIESLVKALKKLMSWLMFEQSPFDQITT